MKTYKVLLILIYLLVSLLHSENKKISIVTTTEDIASIVKWIGGEHVEVLSLTKGFQNPHFIQAKPSYMLKLNKADILFYIGLELEVGWLPLLVRGARNPKLIQGDLSKNISILEVPQGEISRAQGDIHPGGNPHYWLNPNNGIILSETIANYLNKADSKNEFFYEKKKKDFILKIKNKIVNWESKTKMIKGMNFIAYHKEFEYLAKWLGFNIKNYLENKPGVPPASRYIYELIQEIKSKKYQVLICTDNSPERNIKKIESATQIEIIKLPTSVGMGENNKNYFDLFDEIISKLAALDL